MVLPLFRFFAELHNQLDAVEKGWPLQSVPLSWLLEIDRWLYEEWAELDRRIRQLAPLLAQQSEARQRFLQSIGYFSLNMFWEAKEQLDAIIDKVPNTVLSYLLRAAVHYELQNYESAWHDLTRLDAVAADSPAVHVVRHMKGCVLAKMDRWNEAKACFEQVYRANPGHVEAMFNLALCYHHLGYRQQSVYLMRNLSALRPHDRQAKRLLAYFTRDAAT